MAICRATRKFCFLTITHDYLPSPNYKTFFPDGAGFGYLLSKASGSNSQRQITALQKSYTRSFNLHREQVIACIRSRYNLPLLCGGLIGEQIRPRKCRYRLDLNCVTLQGGNKMNYQEISSMMGSSSLFVQICRYKLFSLWAGHDLKYILDASITLLFKTRKLSKY